MGAIRVPVRVTNAIDEALVYRNQLTAGEVRFAEVNGLVDMGAVRSVLPIDVVERLGLRIRRHTMAEYADGRNEAVGVTEPVILEVLDRETLEEALVLGNEVLIGQTVLKKLDLLADCANQRLVPNPEHPDQAVSIVKRAR